MANIYDSSNQSIFQGKCCGVELFYDFVLCEPIKLKCLSFTCKSDNFAAKKCQRSIHDMCTCGWLLAIGYRISYSVYVCVPDLFSRTKLADDELGMGCSCRQKFSEYMLSLAVIDCENNNKEHKSVG